MIESQVRALFTEIAEQRAGPFAGGYPARPPPGPGPAALAPGRRGGHLGRWPRSRSWFSPWGWGRSGPVPARRAAGPSAPRQFNPLVPYLSFGWLPAGNSLVAGGSAPGRWCG